MVRKGENACYKQFSFSHNVFHSYISLMRQNATLCGNGLNICLLQVRVRELLRQIFSVWNFIFNQT